MSIWKSLELLEEKGPFGETLYINDIYQVNVRRMEDNLVHLSIKRRDKKPSHNWRHFQYIKNEICGEETFAFEIYPPESCLVDMANQYHLWVTDKGNLPSFAFSERLVCEKGIPGSVQEPWETNMRPPDLMTEEEILKAKEKMMENT